LYALLGHDNTLFPKAANIHFTRNTPQNHNKTAIFPTLPLFHKKQKRTELRF
jgi:hypothetical protein